MTADAKGISTAKPKQPKRRLRNFLLEPRFQLKYTLAAVLVTVLVTGVVGAWLGSEAYSYSKGMSQMLLMQQEMSEMEVDAALHELFEREAAERDAQVLGQIAMGIGALVVILSLALGFTGIIVTHRVVGPAYKLRLLLGDVASGQLNTKGGLRKGDELQHVGIAFKDMVVALRARREEELAQLDEALETAKDEGANDAVVEKLERLRERLAAVLDT